MSVVIQVYHSGMEPTAKPVDVPVTSSAYSDSSVSYACGIAACATISQMKKAYSRTDAGTLRHCLARYARRSITATNRSRSMEQSGMAAGGRTPPTPRLAESASSSSATPANDAPRAAANRPASADDM